MGKVNEWLVFVSNVGVIAGVLFVAFEIRQNSQLASATIRQEIAHTDLQSSLTVASEQSLAEALAASQRKEVLTDAQESQLRALIYATHRRMENVYYQFKEGMIDSGQWKGYCRNLARLETGAAQKQYSVLSNYSEEFQEFLIDVRNNPDTCESYD